MLPTKSQKCPRAVDEITKMPLHHRMGVARCLVSGCSCVHLEWVPSTPMTNEKDQNAPDDVVKAPSPRTGPRGAADDSLHARACVKAACGLLGRGDSDFLPLHTRCRLGALPCMGLMRQNAVHTVGCQRFNPCTGVPQGSLRIARAWAFEYFSRANFL